jgi:uncharacterized phage protein (TIGR01671 family)
MKMREIEFRGLGIFDGKWAYGGISNLDSNAPAIITKNFNEGESPSAHVVERKTVGEYTGVKVKNGMKIYEGDIISFDMFGAGDSEKAYIKFEDGSFVAQTSYSPGLDGTHHGQPLSYELGKMIKNDKDVEVIGNVHDMPDWDF